eukprot:5532000-Prymnesium_polylepis.1
MSARTCAPTRRRDEQGRRGAVSGAGARAGGWSRERGGRAEHAARWTVHKRGERAARSGTKVHGTDGHIDAHCETRSGRAGPCAHGGMLGREGSEYTRPSAGICADAGWWGGRSSKAEYDICVR